MYMLYSVHYVLFVYSCTCYCYFSFVPSLPNGGLFIDVLFDAVEIAIVGFALNIAQAKLLAIKNGYTIHPDQVQYIYNTLTCTCMLTNRVY